MSNERSYALSPLGVELLTKEISGVVNIYEKQGDTKDFYVALEDIREVLRKANLYHEEEAA